MGQAKLGRPTRLGSELPLCSLAMSQGSFFPEPHSIVPDGEVIETLRTAIARAGRLPRSADLLLCSLCAEYLVTELGSAGLTIVRTRNWEAGA
jgi:hypothetical protein